MSALGSTMRVLRPAPNVLAFYDGRVPGVRAYSEAPNWLDDGAYELGACSYAIVDGAEALVYDTHMSLAHAALVRRTLEAMGVSSLKVVLSHWHADHVAGNAVFADCEILANRLTAETLAEQRTKLETGSPPIRPLVGPTRTFDTSLKLVVGTIDVDLLQVDIHSRDGTVLLLPDRELLFAGDTLEDPITYVTEPDRLADHLVDLDRMATWAVRRILPNHGSPEIIAAGGYGPGLIGATRAYVAALLRCRSEPALAGLDLAAFAADSLTRGDVSYFSTYEAVHRRNVEAVLKANASGA